MDLLVKVKKEENLKKIISNVNKDKISFNKGEEQINYSPETSLEENQTFKIENFKEKDFCLEYLKSQFATAHYSQWDKKEMQLEYFLQTDGDNFYFIKFSQFMIIKDKIVFSLSEEPKIINDNRLLTISNYADAFYEKNSDTLFFKKLSDLKKIFKGIESLLIEATQQEVDSFLNNKIFNLRNYNTKKVKPLNRKRIGLVKEKLNSLNDKKKEIFLENLKKYCPEIKIENNQIIIEFEKNLKNITFALDERFYTTSEDEKRLANSIIPLKN